ncbi:MAG: hypothetical protein U1F54_05555 [Burkholderiales bacterium]
MNRPWVAPRYLSLFGWSRPPLPWEIADEVAVALDTAKVESVGITGSLSPSVLASVGYGSERKLNAYAFDSSWSEGMGWNCVIEDSPGMEETCPWAQQHLPRSALFWDGPTPMLDSQALFVDLPFDHRAVRVKLEALKTGSYRLVLLGFLEDHAGPHDVHDYFTQLGFTWREAIETVKSAELSSKLQYRLLVGAPPRRTRRRRARHET